MSNPISFIVCKSVSGATNAISFDIVCESIFGATRFLQEVQATQVTGKRGDTFLDGFTARMDRDAKGRPLVYVETFPQRADAVLTLISKCRARLALAA
jgi:hypothetical protein